MNILRLRRSRKRFAISEVMGSLLMITITLIAGMAVFGFVNSASGSSAQAVGTQAAQNANFLNEREEVLTACLAANSGDCQSTSVAGNVFVFVYNSGTIDPENMTEVYVTNVNTSPQQVCGPITVASSQNLIPKGQTGVISFGSGSCISSGFNIAAGGSYAFKVVGKYGSSAQTTVTF